MMCQLPPQQQHSPQLTKSKTRPVNTPKPGGGSSSSTKFGSFCCNVGGRIIFRRPLVSDLRTWMALAGICWCAVSQFSCLISLGNCIMTTRNTLHDTFQQQPYSSVEYYDNSAPVLLNNKNNNTIKNHEEVKGMELFSINRHLDDKSTITTILTRTATPITTTSTASYTSRFNISLESTLRQRGLNAITVLSGCSLAAWVYQGHPLNSECYFPTLYNKKSIVSNNYTTVHTSQELTEDKIKDIQPYDTIYTNLWGLGDFVRDVLPRLKNDNIVLITGRWWYNHSQIQSHKVPIETENALLNSKKIVKVLTHNLGTYYHNTDHPKLGVWPFGIQNIAYNKSHTPPVEVYQRAFWKHYNNNTTKTKGVLRGPISRNTNPTARANVPTGKKLSLWKFYDEVATHQFILSPQGDRPECYRHYEAIGLGTIPVTDLTMTKPFLHLQPGPILYNTTHWYLKETHGFRRLGVKEFPSVHKLLITEEYWMEYADRQVNGGTKLRWFDRFQSKQVTLDDFVSI
jgi:hypothetical protein